jgi:hypothetical protein
MAQSGAVKEFKMLQLATNTYYSRMPYHQYLLTLNHCQCLKLLLKDMVLNNRYGVDAISHVCDKLTWFELNQALPITLSCSQEVVTFLRYPRKSTAILTKYVSGYWKNEKSQSPKPAPWFAEFYIQLFQFLTEPNIATFDAIIHAASSRDSKSLFLAILF